MLKEDEEFEKRKERARLLRNSVGMITNNDLESNSTLAFDNDFQSKLNRAKELRNSVGMITNKDLEQPEESLNNINNLQDYDFNLSEEANLIEELNNNQIEKTEKTVMADNVNNTENNTELQERVNVLLNGNKPTNLLTDKEKIEQQKAKEQSKQIVQETNSDKNLFSQIGKTIENLWLGITSNAKAGAKYITQAQHNPHQETELLQDNKDITAMEYLNQLNNNPIVNKAEKQIEINNNLSGLKNNNNFAWSQEKTTLSDIGAMSKVDEDRINQELENREDAYGNIELNPIQRELSKSIVEEQNKIASNVNKIDNPIMKKISELAPSAGNSLFGAGISLINPYLGMNYFMINAAGMYEADGRARGMSKAEARAYGTIMGYAEGATEMLEISEFLKAGKSLRKGAIKDAIKHYGLDMADNAVQEAIIDPIDELTAQLTSGKTKHDYSKNQGWNELLNDMVQDGIDGALSSLLLNGIDVGINSSVKLYNKIQNNIQPTKQDITNAYTDIQNNPNINITQHIKDSMEYQKQKILNGDNQVYSVIELDQNGNVTGITQVAGSPIEQQNKNLNINPVVVYTDGYYNIIDADSGLKLDSTIYDSKENAIKGFNNIINKADNATIDNVNDQITKTKLALIEKMQDIKERIIANPEEAQKQNKISFVNDNKIYSTQETADILNKYNIEQNLNSRPYLGQEINDIINNKLSQLNQNKNIDTFNNETANYTTENIKTEYEPNRNKKETIKRTFEKEIENHKNKSKTDNKVTGDLLEINSNIYDGISKKKQSSFMNEYLKNEVQGHDYYVDGNKINATSVTVGKLKNGKTNFDKNISQNIRYEIKANIIGNLESFLSTSQIYQPDRIDTKNHTFANTFDRRKSIVKYKGQNYEVMFDIGKKNGVNTLYGIESVKKTNKNRLSLPNLASNNRGLNDTNKSVGSHKSKDSITQKNTSVKSNSQNTNIQDFGEKIGGARKDLSTPRTNTKSGKEVIHDYTVQNTENGYSVNFKGKVLNDGFKTQAEAEQYILDFKNNIKNNRAFVEERNSLNSLLMTEGNKYLVYLRNPRTLKSQYTGKSFANKQDAENYAMALSMYLKENGKNLFRPQIQKVERINANNKNATKATGDDILNNFGFKGGEFGNWVKQSERQQFLNYAQDAFTDLAAALDITPDSLGQQGAMSIAFGARGQGLTGAVAHFEPGKKVINMTRLKGAGSLAHEYGHSIDNYLSREGGYDADGMVTQNSRNPKLSDNMKNAIKEVTDAMKYNVSTNQEEIDKKNAIYEKHRIENLEYNLRYIDKVFRGEAKNLRRIKGKYEDVPIKVTEKQKSDYKKIRNTLIDGKVTGDIDYKLNSQTLKTEKTYPEPINTLQKMYKEVVGRKLDDDTVYSLYRQGKQARQVTEVKSESGYSKSALELDKATGRTSAYFSRIDEMWARAFESYISDKLKAKGIKDTYLVHSVNNNEYALFNPFPAGEERKNINKAFDNLIQTMKDEGLFTSSGTPQNIDNDTGIRYMKKNKVSKQSLAKQFENITGETIAMAEAKLAGIEMRNIQRQNGNLTGEFEKNPYSKEAMAIYNKYYNSKESSKYLYHSTPRENLQSIIENGLTIGNKQNQEGISSKTKIYLSATEELAESFTPDDSVTLRVNPKAKLENLESDLLGGEGSYSITNNIPANMLQIKENGKWVNLQNNIEKETDNHGRTLTKQQQEYFKGSKVRDKEGNLLVVYHGSKNKFKQFNSDVNWFTSSKQYSEYYGRKQNKLQEKLGIEPKKSKYTYKVYLDIKNPKILGNIDGYIKNTNEKTTQFDWDVEHFLKDSSIPYNDFKKIVDSYNIGKDENMQAYRIYEIINSKEFASYLISKGYDGIIANEKRKYIICCIQS